jgi:hypothetical protein
VALVGWALAAHSALPEERKRMSSVFYQPSLDQPLKLEIKPTPIRQTDKPAVRTQAPAPLQPGYIRCFANDQLNSRVRAGLPRAEWKVRWKTALEPDVYPAFVLVGDAQIVLQGASSAVALCDRQGRTMVTLAKGPGMVALDPSEGLFYHPDPSGLLVARLLTNAAVAFRFFPMFSKGYERRHISRSGQRMLIVSFEPAAMSHFAPLRTPEMTSFEVQDLGKPLQLGEENILESATRTATLFSRTLPLLTALGRKSLVIAVPDHLYLAGADLNVKAALEDRFLPVAMSLDEEDLIYLIAQTNEHVALWVVTPDGRRLVNYPLPSGVVPGQVPPVIGLDHRTYLLTHDRVLAISPNGTLAWAEDVQSAPVGAIVSSNGWLIASIGSRVVAYEPAGRSIVLQSFGEELSTPPVLTDKEEIIVASSHNLYCLAPANGGNER